MEAPPLTLVFLFGITIAWLIYKVIASMIYKAMKPWPGPSTTFGDARWSDLKLDHKRLSELLDTTSLSKWHHRWPWHLPTSTPAPDRKGIFLGIMISEHARSFNPLIYTGPRHLLTVAPNRTGKGACAIIPNLLTLKNQSVVVIDPKGENAAVTARRRREFGNAYLLNPFNEHGLGTARFNPLAHLSINHPNLVAETAGQAEALIVGSDNEGGNAKHFNDSARTLVQVIMLHLIAQKGGAATLIDMRRVLTLDSKGFFDVITEMMISPHGFISQPAAQFEKDTKEIQSILSTARTQTAFLDDPPIARVLSGSDFTMLDLKARITSVYIILPSRFLVAYARFFRLLVVSAIDQLLSRPGGVKTTLILDEFAALGHLSAIETAFGQAAGFNVQLWPFLQDLNQLKDIYRDRWESFIANSGAVQWFTPNDMFTAEYLSKRLGNQTVVTRSSNFGENQRADSTGSSSSETFGETGRPFMTPTDLMGLESNVAILTASGLKYGIRATRLAYNRRGFKGAGFNGDKVCNHYYSGLAGLYDPNPFYGDYTPPPTSPA